MITVVVEKFLLISEYGRNKIRIDDGHSDYNAILFPGSKNQNEIETVRY